MTESSETNVSNPSYNQEVESRSRFQLRIIIASLESRVLDEVVG